MSSAVPQIKEKLNIVDVISSYLKLEKAGANWRACCPFHHEKTPSFFVSPARDTFHCFGCNRGGDIFTFVQEIEGLDFMGSLKVLAERAGVVLDMQSLKRDPEEGRLYRVLEAASSFYSRELVNAEEVRNYLKQRGVNGESAKNFGLGWAPPGWQGLYNDLVERGFAPTDMIKAGLVVESTKPGSQNRCYDRFRSRIMFPLRDSSGRVVGFSGRIFGSADDGTVAKYVNSPETPVYQKSRLLFGFDQAKLELKREDFCVLVEGQFDLVMSHQAGVRNAVAVSGTALTRDHLELIKRFTSNIVMAFDGDSAGFKAARRAIELGLELGLEMRIAKLPAGQDPASVCQTDPEAWRTAVKSATHVIDFLLQAIGERLADIRLRAHAIKAEVYPYIARLQQRIDQAYFIAKVTELTGLSEEVIRADLASERRPLSSSPEPRVESTANRGERISERLFGLGWWKNFTFTDELLPGSLAERKEQLIMEAELAYQGFTAEQLQQEYDLLVRAWQREQLKDRLQVAMRELAEAERQNDQPAIDGALARCRELSQSLNNLKK